jgi:DHA2 family multidrug resistance protein-like MFS transporter
MSNASPPRAGRREWIALGVLILPLLLVSMDVSVLYFAVPFISRDLAPSATQQLWIFDVYGFVLAGLLITMGSLGDRIGRRRLLLIGAVGFSAASFVAAYAPSAEVLIGARALLGVAGATLMPSTLAMIRNLFHDERQRGTAIAIWTAVMTGGIALGPVLSGVLLEHFWWGSVFLINVPAMVLLLVLGPILLPEFRNPAAGRFDLTSSILSLAAVLPVVWGLKETAADGFDAAPSVAVVLGLVVGALFVRRQRRLADPMIDLDLLANRAYGGSLVANTVAMFALVGNAVFMTQYLQSVLGQSPLVAALWSLVPSVVVGAAAPLAASLGKSHGRARVMSGAFVVGAGGFAVLSRVHADSRIIVLLVGAALLAAGLVAVLSLVTEVVMGAVSPERAGSASAVMETMSEFGGAMGIAVLGSIGSAVYGSRMADSLPAGLPASAANAASDTLAGATVVAGRLPEVAGADLLHAARVAFSDGLDAVSVVGCVILLAAAVMCAVLLRRSDPVDASPERAEPRQAENASR